MPDASASKRKMRLDQLLVERGLFATRSRARDAIRRGSVSSQGSLLAKPGHMVETGIALQVDDAASGYVSRAALKLIHGLEVFGFDPSGKICLWHLPTASRTP